MKKHFNFQKVAMATFLLSLPLVSFSQFTLSGEVRPRSEFRNGFKTTKKDGQEAAFFTEQRSRIYFDYAQPKYQLKLAFQDIRIWGETTQIFKEEAGKTFISEAWGKYNFAPKLSIKVGRQIISYDNQRFLGGLEWAQQGRRHDAALLIHENKEGKVKFHLGVAVNSDDDVAEPADIQSKGASFYSVGGSYKSFQYGWFNKEFSGGNLSLLAFNAGYQNADSTVSYKQTYGLVGSKKIGKVTLATDLYYQGGKLNNHKVNALLAGVNITVPTKATPITLGAEYISGKSDDDNSTTITNFSPDFGTNHAFNGLMDYFFVGPANGNVGVTDLYLKTKFKVAKGALLVHGHQFMTGSTQLNEQNGELNKSMGAEIDFVYVRKFDKDVTLHLGFSQLFATDTMLSLRGGGQKSNNWAWAMLTFKPTFFKSEKKD